MGSHKDRPQVSRLEIIETGRRRRWSDAEKLRIVEASFLRRRMVSATARQHGISRSLLSIWRKRYREGRLGGYATASFAPVIITPEPSPVVRAETRPGPRADCIEIVLAGGRRIIVGVDVDAAALARVVAVLERA